jgi:S-layer protein
MSLTTGIDASGQGAFATSQPTGNSVINAADTTVGGAAAQTWTALDQITATGSNNTFNVATASAIAANPAGSVVTGVQTMNVAESGAAAVVTLNTIAFTGLTSLTVTNAGTGTDTITAALTTNVTNTGASTGAVVINGGNNVTVTTAGGLVTIGSAAVGTGATASPAGAIAVTQTATAALANTIYGGTSVSLTETGSTGNLDTIGSAAVAPTGAVTVSRTYTTGAVTAAGNTAAAPTGNGIIIVGGSTDSVTETVGTNTTNANTANLGAVSITGGAATTAVTVTQSAAVGAAATVNNGANTSNGVAATSGIVDGTVYVADKNAGTTTTNTLTSVTLNNYGVSTISSTALNTVTLSGTGGTLGITAGGTTPITILTAKLGGGSMDTITVPYSTLNTVMSANTTLAGVTDSALRTLNLSGTGVLYIANPASTGIAALTTITETGAAGLTATVSGIAGITALNFAASSGANTVAISATTQTYAGGSGNDLVTINADATKVISGGAGVDTIVLNTNGGLTAANTGTNVTGFEIVGFAGASQGFFDLNALNLAANTTQISQLAAVAGNLTASGIAATTTSFSTTGNQIGTTTFTYAGTNGANTAVTLNLAGAVVSAANGGLVQGLSDGSFLFQDANSIGVGTINLVSNATIYQGLDTITSLQNSSTSALSSLNISGAGSITIVNTQTTATSLAISDTGLGTSATADGIQTLTAAGNVLGNINYSGTHAFTIGILTDNVANLVITNVNAGSTGVLTIGGHSDASLVTLTLNGAVKGIFNNNAATNAVTVSAATDNEQISFTHGAGAVADTYILGNGSNFVSDSSTGVVKITSGTGFSTLAATGAQTGADAMVVGAHTSTAGGVTQIQGLSNVATRDAFQVGAGGAAIAGTTANVVTVGTTITGAVTNDYLGFNSVAVSATQTTLTSANLSAFLADVATTVAASATTGFNWYVDNSVSGYTFIVEHRAGVGGAASAFTTGDSLVVLIGNHNITFAQAASITLAS